MVKTPAGFLLETALAQTAALAKRLTLYKLRAKVEIKDAAGEVVVAVSQGVVRARPRGAIAFVDPRDAAARRPRADSAPRRRRNCSRKPEPRA